MDGMIAWTDVGERPEGENQILSVLETMPDTIALYRLFYIWCENDMRLLKINKKAIAPFKKRYYWALLKIQKKKSQITIEF